MTPKNEKEERVMKKALTTLLCVGLIFGIAGFANAGPVINSPGASSSDSAAAANAGANVNVSAENASAWSQQSSTVTANQSPTLQVTSYGSPIPVLPETVQPTNPWLINAPANGTGYPNYQPARLITLYKKTFTLAELKNMMRGGDVDVIANPLKDGGKAVKEVTVLITAPVKNEDTGKDEPSVYPGYDAGGFVTAKADDSDTVSVHTVAAAAYEAGINGCDAIQVTVEGFEKHARGWSFGMSLGGVLGWLATAGVDNTASSLSINGPGISWGDSYNLGKPFVTAVMLKKV